VKRITVALAALVACGLSVVAAPQGAGGDKAKLQGTWELSKMSFGGKDFPLPENGKLVLTFKGDKVIAKQPGKPDEDRGYSVDESKKPSVMTVAKTDKEKEMKGIFKVEGDTLTVGMSKPGDPVPAGFDGKDVMLMTFKKAKDQK
jgi:uncharacterized protein (TIGR03067 family)